MSVYVEMAKLILLHHLEVDVVASQGSNIVDPFPSSQAMHVTPWAADI